MVPLVFKTSLGAVRSPEGSTPSLLRQDASWLWSRTLVARNQPAIEEEQDVPPAPRN